MNENFYDSSSEKLMALLDGELSREEAGTLYYELASNHDLQEELHQLISMKKLISLDNVMPPASLKTGILFSSGLASEAEILHAESDTSGASAGLYKAITGKPFLMAISALVAFFMAAAYFTNQKAYTSEMADVFKAIPVVYSYDYRTPPPIEAFNNNEDESGFYENIRMLNNAADNKQNTNNGEAYNTLNAFVESSETVVPIAEHDNFANDLSFSNVTLSNITPYRYASLPQTSQFKPDYNPLEEKDDDGVIENKFSLSLKGYSAKSFPELNIDPLTDPILKNYALALMWNFSNNNALGVELGQEDFYQQYTSMENGSQYEIMQNWRAFIIGLAYQYTMDAIHVAMIGDINPYFKIFGGGTAVGSLMKGGAGIQYYLNKKMAFFAGLEASWLRYTHQDNSFNTNKLGLVYGVNVRF